MGVGGSEVREVMENGRKHQLDVRAVSVQSCLSVSAPYTPTRHAHGKRGGEVFGIDGFHVRHTICCRIQNQQIFG